MHTSGKNLLFHQRCYIGVVKHVFLLGVEKRAEVFLSLSVGSDSSVDTLRSCEDTGVLSEGQDALLCLSISHLITSCYPFALLPGAFTQEHRKQYSFVILTMLHQC